MMRTGRSNASSVVGMPRRSTTSFRKRSKASMVSTPAGSASKKRSTWFQRSTSRGRRVTLPKSFWVAINVAPNARRSSRFSMRSRWLRFMGKRSSAGLSSAR
jgi:hypothetical protein